MPTTFVNGHRMHYRMYGKGMPILFVHPPLLTSKNFVYSYRDLSSDYCAIGFDIRGHGSSEPSSIPVTYSLIADDICGLLNELRIDRCLLCGYSTGGAVALETMLRHPDRVAGGVLVSTMPEVSDIVLAWRIRLAIAATRWLRMRPLSAAICGGNADTWHTYRMLHDDAMHGNMNNIGQYYWASLQYRCTSELKKVTQPQLLLYGQKDSGFHRYAVQLQERLPNQTIRIIPGVSHQIPTKAADEMHEMMREWIHGHRFVLK